jgi:hypothetical protein
MRDFANNSHLEIPAAAPSLISFYQVQGKPTITSAVTWPQMIAHEPAMIWQATISTATAKELKTKAKAFEPGDVGSIRASTTHGKQPAAQSWTSRMEPTAPAILNNKPVNGKSMDSSEMVNGATCCGTTFEENFTATLLLPNGPHLLSFSHFFNRILNCGILKND